MNIYKIHKNRFEIFSCPKYANSFLLYQVRWQKHSKSSQKSFQSFSTTKDVSSMYLVIHLFTFAHF